MYFNGFKFLVDEIQPHDLKSQAIGLGGGSGSHPGKVGKAQLWGPLLLLGSPPPAQKPHRLGCLGWGVWHGSRNLRVPGQREGLGAPLPPSVSMVLLMGKEICVITRIWENEAEWRGWVRG